MAYAFNGTSQYISGNAAPANATPLTVAAFVLRNDSNVNSFICIENSTNSESFKQGFFSNTAFGMSTVAGTGQFSQSPASSFPISTIIHAATTFIGGTSRVTYANGSAGSTNTASSSPNAAVIDRLKISGQATSGGGVTAYWNGQISEVGIWNVTLTAAEIASLSKGFKPYRVRPQSLVFYAPLIRDLSDVRGGIALTNNGSATVATHPRVY